MTGPRNLLYFRRKIPPPPPDPHSPDPPAAPSRRHRRPPIAPEPFESDTDSWRYSDSSPPDRHARSPAQLARRRFRPPPLRRIPARGDPTAGTESGSGFAADDGRAASCLTNASTKEGTMIRARALAARAALLPMPPRSRRRPILLHRHGLQPGDPGRRNPPPRPKQFLRLRCP